ncbi:MAG: PAS domain-containing protein, partial [Acidobacteriota bacterium]
LLANAPIGFAFFDRKMRYVRMNQFLAEMDQLSITHHLGRTVQEVFPGPVGMQLAASIEKVFATGEPIHEQEIHGELPAEPASPRIWLISLYPVRRGGERPADGRPMPMRTSGDRMLEAPPDSPNSRWVGAVIVDARGSCRKNCFGEQKSWRQPGSWRLLLRTKSITRWKR